MYCQSFCFILCVTIFNYVTLCLFSQSFILFILYLDHYTWFRTRYSATSWGLCYSQHSNVCKWKIIWREGQFKVHCWRLRCNTRFEFMWLFKFTLSYSFLLKLNNAQNKCFYKMKNKQWNALKFLLYLNNQITNLWFELKNNLL